MSDCIDYNCAKDLGSHLLNDCGEELLGGASGAIVLSCDTQLTDPSNATQVAAEIAAGRATLFRNIKVGINKPAPVEVESNISCGTTQLATYDRSGTWVDGNVNETNRVLYDILNSGKPYGGLVLYLCGTLEASSGEKVEWIDAAVKFTGGKILPNQNNTFQTFESDFKWRKKTGQAIVDAPAGIF
ncbi:MAG: hypothetical protein V4608_11015 [Bacteroidota bacterium]